MWRIQVNVIAMVAIALGSSVCWAQIDCRELPPGEREAGLARGTCVLPPTDKKLPRFATEKASLVVSPCSGLKDFSNQPAKDVITAVKRGLIPKTTLGEVTQQRSSRPAGTIIRQVPKVEHGSCVVNLWVSDGSMVKVPNVAGRSEGDAQKLLYGNGLKMTSSTEVSRSTAAGHVISQLPGPDSEVSRGSSVRVMIAVAPPPVKKPDVVLVPPPIFVPEKPKVAPCAALQDFTNQPSEQLVAAVKSGKLRATRIVETLQAHSSSPAGTVVKQVAKDGGGYCAVTLVVSDGSLVKVPDVQRRSQADAENLLRAEDLQIAPTKEETAKFKAGYVLSQKPEPGREVPRGTSVQVNVAVAPIPVNNCASLPDFSNRTLADVVGAIRNGSYGRVSLPKKGPEERASSKPRGTILGQTSQEAVGYCLVTLWISDGNLTVVPVITGQTLDGARERLSARELRLASSPQYSENDAKAGTILRQSIRPDTEVTKGSEIAVVVSRGPRPPEVVVPDLVNKRFDVAGQIVEGIQLRSKATEIDSPAEPMLVLRQSPAPGNKVPIGTTIELTVSRGLEVPDLVSNPNARLPEGLVVERVPRESNEPKGTLLSQVPGPGARSSARTPVILYTSAGPRTPPWEMIAAAIAVIAVVGAAIWKRVPKPKPPPPPITASAQLDLHAAKAEIDGAAPSGPAIRIQARTVPGEGTIELEETSHERNT